MRCCETGLCQPSLHAPWVQTLMRTTCQKNAGQMQGTQTLSLYLRTESQFAYAGCMMMRRSEIGMSAELHVNGGHRLGTLLPNPGDSKGGSNPADRPVSERLIMHPVCMECVRELQFGSEVPQPVMRRFPALQLACEWWSQVGYPPAEPWRQ